MRESLSPLPPRDGSSATITTQHCLGSPPGLVRTCSCKRAAEPTRRALGRVVSWVVACSEEKSTYVRTQKREHHIGAMPFFFLFGSDHPSAMRVEQVSFGIKKGGGRKWVEGRGLWIVGCLRSYFPGNVN